MSESFDAFGSCMCHGVLPVWRAQCTHHSPSPHFLKFLASLQQKESSINSWTLSQASCFCSSNLPQKFCHRPKVFLGVHYILGLEILYLSLGSDRSFFCGKLALSGRIRVIVYSLSPSTVCKPQCESSSVLAWNSNHLQLWESFNFPLVIRLQSVVHTVCTQACRTLCRAQNSFPVTKTKIWISSSFGSLSGSPIHKTLVLSLNILYGYWLSSLRFSLPLKFWFWFYFLSLSFLLSQIFGLKLKFCTIEFGVSTYFRVLYFVFHRKFLVLVLFLNFWSGYENSSLGNFVVAKIIVLVWFLKSGLTLVHKCFGKNVNMGQWSKPCGPASFICDPISLPFSIYGLFGHTRVLVY